MKEVRTSHTHTHTLPRASDMVTALGLVSLSEYARLEIKIKKWKGGGRNMRAVLINKR